MYQTLILKSKEKKEEIWLSPVTKTPTPTEQSKKERDNIKRHQKLWLHNSRSESYSVLTTISNFSGKRTLKFLVCWFYISMHL